MEKVFMVRGGVTRQVGGKRKNDKINPAFEKESQIGKKKRGGILDHS